MVPCISSQRKSPAENNFLVVTQQVRDTARVKVIMLAATTAKTTVTACMLKVCQALISKDWILN